MLNTFTISIYRETSEGIEMAVMSSSSHRPSITPPVQCSSRNSMAESRESSKRMGKSPMSSADLIDETIASSKSTDNHGKDVSLFYFRGFAPNTCRY